jgi:hypothetical protein
MSAMNNFTARYAHALLAATRREDLAQPDRPKKIRGLTAEQMARMEREMDGLQREFKAVSASYGDTVLNLVVASGYVSRLIGNPGVSGYLARASQRTSPEHSRACYCEPRGAGADCSALSGTGLGCQPKERRGVEGIGCDTRSSRLLNAPSQNHLQIVPSPKAVSNGVSNLTLDFVALSS